MNSAQLYSLQDLLSHAQMALRRGTDPSSEKLRHRLRELQTVGNFLASHKVAATEEIWSKFVSDAVAFHERVKAWAKKNNVHYVSKSSSPTLPRLSREEIQRALHGVAPGEPLPDSVLADVLDAQQVVQPGDPPAKDGEEP